MRFREGFALAGALLICGVAAGSEGLLSETTNLQRSLTSSRYEVTVHKGGRTDVILRSGLPVFKRAYPMIWFDGDKRPKQFKLDSRFSAREEVSNGLGMGHGLALRGKECLWLLQSYPVQPFMTVQLSYTNTKKKPVRIKMLMPWCVGDLTGGAVTLGPGTANARVLENGRALSGDSDWPDVTTSDTLSDWYMAAYNEEVGLSLLTGFLTHSRAMTQVRMLHDDEQKADKFPRYRAECIYDPPVELGPGETLVSEILYIAPAESSPNDALERFGHAVAVVNGIPVDHGKTPHGPTAQAGATPPTEQSLRKALAAQDAQLKRYGWTHFTIPAGWEAVKGDCLPDPARFPNGLKPLVDDVHARGMTVGLALDPFVVSLESAVAREHPEWLIEPAEADQAVVADDQRVLNLAVPGVADHVRAVCERAVTEWGVDALVGLTGLRAVASAATPADAAPMTAYHAGLDAVRAGAGSRTYIEGAPPLTLAAGFTQGARFGHATGPYWKTGQPDGVWGCVESVTNAARRYHLAPYVWTPDFGPAWFGQTAAPEDAGVEGAAALSPEHSLAWLTVLAMSGSAITVGDSFDTLTPEQLGVLRRLLPRTDFRARPIDLFRDGPARVWSMPIEHGIGDWQVLALCNWGDEAESISLPFDRLGLRPRRYYALYEFWQDRYLGTASDQLTISVPPGGVRLVCLRPSYERPMFLATDSHYTMGATDFTALSWDSAARTLSGTFEAVADTVYNLRVLVPPSYKLQGVTSTCGTPEVGQTGAILRIGIHVAQTGPVTWTARF